MARRTLAFLVALFAATFVAACAQSVTGTGTLAVNAGGGEGPTSTSSPTDPNTTESPSDTGSPTESPSESPTTSESSSGGDETSEVCQALDKAAVEQLLGAPVTLARSQSSGCQIRASNGKSLIVAVFDYLTLTEYKKGQFQELQVGGHPAVRTDSNIMYVARSTDPDDEGLLAAYYSGLTPGGDNVAAALLQQLLQKYSK